MSTSRLLFPAEGLGWDKIEPFLSEMAMVDAYVVGIEAMPRLKMHARPDLTVINFGSDAIAAGRSEGGKTAEITTQY